MAEKSQHPDVRAHPTETMCRLMTGLLFDSDPYSTSPTNRSSSFHMIPTAGSTLESFVSDPSGEAFTELEPSEADQEREVEPESIPADEFYPYATTDDERVVGLGPLQLSGTGYHKSGIHPSSTTNGNNSNSNSVRRGHDFHPQMSSPFPFNLTRGSLRATPEDRQRAVAHMLARGGSFSEKHGLDEEPSPDSNDNSPNTSPMSCPIPVPSAPPEIDFSKEVVTPARSYTSGLAGIHRPSVLDGRPIIQTPNRYTIETPNAVEYSESGQRKAKLFKCSIFLPTPDTECLQMSLKPGTTASQLVIKIISDYLRTHPQPAPTMLGQPTTYRLYLAEDDGELDDSFPPLDPNCVVSTTSADCFALQRRVAPSTSTIPAPASVSGLGPSAIRPRIGGMSVSSGDEPSTSRGELDEDGNEIHGSYRNNGSNRPSVNGGHRKSQRTSSDAEYDVDELHRSRGSSTPGPEQTGDNNRNRSHSFTPFTWRSCLRCGCFGTEEEAEKIEPNEPRRRSSQG